MKSSFILLAALYRAQVNLEDVQMGGVYDVTCDDPDTDPPTTTLDCLFDNTGGFVDESRIITIGDLTLDIGAGEWCQFTYEGHAFANGFQKSSYTGEVGDRSVQTVYGDEMQGKQILPSYGVLIVGSGVEEDHAANCGQILKLRKADTDDRHQYIVIAATKQAPAPDIGSFVEEEAVLLMVSPRVMSTACCANVECLEEGSVDHVPELKNCFEDSSTPFEIIAMEIGGDSIAFGQSTKVMGVSLDNAINCEEFAPEDGDKLAQAIQLDGTYYNLLVVDPPSDASAAEACGFKYDVYNEKDETNKIQVVVASYMDLDPAAATVSDGTYFLRVTQEDCEMLCGVGECTGGRMGSPPPHCHLSFVEAGTEGTTDEPETPTETHSQTETGEPETETGEPETPTETGEPETPTETDEETEPELTPPAGYEPGTATSWGRLATCAEFSCLSGNLVIPTECGKSADDPCYASTKGPEVTEDEETTCGAIYELQSVDGDSLFVQIIDFADSQQEDRFEVSPYGYPVVCQKACTNDYNASVCRSECAPEEEEEPGSCYCAVCEGHGIGSGNHEDTCKDNDACEDCYGDCLSLPGPHHAVTVATVYSKFEKLGDLPSTSSSAMAPACAAAAAFAFLG